MPKKINDLVTKEILNTREAAALLKVTTQTIKNYIYSGKLKAIKTPGGHHRIRRIDLKSLGFVVEEETGQQNFSMDELWAAYNGLLGTFVTTVEVLIKALDTRDIVSSGHSSRVASLACAVGRKMDYSEKDIQELRLAALLHDVGKIGISETILGKPGRLTEQEFFLVKKHPEIGEKIVSGVEHLKSVAPAIRHHHERFNGKGYPDEIAGDDIEMNARIISIADAYDFLRSDLSFRKAFTLDDALLEIKNSAGSQFDPAVASVFVDAVRSEALPLH
ncbi:HD domain-containing phosphohydrolase [Thermodesulfobacteriota bacterium]